MSQETAFAILISLAVGFALGCIYTLFRTRRVRDESDIQLQSLKQSAKEMIESGNLTGLNPHKVYKFCKQYEQISADNKQCHEDISRMCDQIGFILINCDHEPSPDDYTEDIYHVPHYMLLDILERKK